jgi:hypothetical protein
MRRKRTGKAGRLLLVLMCMWVAGIAVVGLVAENALGWFLFFSPGWANGWPFGIRFQAVLSVGLTIHILLMLTTAATGIGAVVGLICTLLGVEWEHVGRGYRSWVWFLAVCLCISIVILLLVSMSVGKAFPHGYDVT